MPPSFPNLFRTYIHTDHSRAFPLPLFSFCLTVFSLFLFFLLPPLSPFCLFLYLERTPPAASHTLQCNVYFLSIHAIHTLETTATGACAPPGPLRVITPHHVFSPPTEKHKVPSTSSPPPSLLLYIPSHLTAFLPSFPPSVPPSFFTTHPTRQLFPLHTATHQSRAKRYLPP